MAPIRRSRREQHVVSVPPKKSVVSTRRISLFERRVSVRLAAAAPQILLEAARVLTEGELEGSGFVGSTMASVDLRKTAGLVSDPVDPSTTELLAGLCREDLPMRAKCRELALGEASKVAGSALDEAQVDFESTARGTELFLSFNVEAKRRIA
jgi:hypothetical protein